jgi:hypothetical protein
MATGHAQSICWYFTTQHAQHTQHRRVPHCSPCGVAGDLLRQVAEQSLFANSTKLAFKEHLAESADMPGLRRPDLVALFKNFTKAAVLIVGRRRIGKTFTFPSLLLKETGAPCYLKVSIDLRGDVQNVGEYLGMPEHRVANLLAIAVALGIPVMADEVQCCTLPGIVKTLLETKLPFLKLQPKRLSFLMFGSHQKRVQEVGASSLYHVTNVEVVDCPFPSLQFLFQLFTFKLDEAPTAEDIVKHLAAFDFDLECVGVDPDPVLLDFNKNPLSVQDVGQVLDPEHFNCLMEVNNKDPKQHEKINQRVLSELLQFGFLHELNNHRLPGAPPVNGYSVSYGPLIFSARVGRKGDWVQRKSAALGLVFEWVVHRFLLPSLLKVLGMEGATFYHGNGPYNLEIDGLAVGDDKAALCSMKLNRGQQNVFSSVFKHLLAYISSVDGFRLLQNKTVTLVLLSYEGGEEKVDAQEAWTAYCKNEKRATEAKDKNSKYLAQGLKNAPEVVVCKSVKVILLRDVMNA